MRITDIPAEVYAVACNYEGINWGAWGTKYQTALERAKEAYEHETRKRGYTAGGLEEAMADYFLKTNDFHPEDGIYAEVGAEGWVRD